jgi:hypothetical protein
MKKQGQTPLDEETKTAADVMQRAIGKTIAQEKARGIGSDRATREAAKDLKDAAERDTKGKAR